MPIRVQNDLPAKKIVENENIFMMDENRASLQDIRPLEIAILNLMPLKEATEIQMLRSLSNTPLQVNMTFLTTSSYVGKNTAKSHLDQFYLNFEDVKDRNFDGLIITGAPVENLEFTEVAYWDELREIMDWSLKHVTSTLHICWGAQAGIYHHYGINKVALDKKMFGIFPHTVYHRKEPFVRGFDDIFNVPHSRHTTILPEDVYANPELTVLSDSPEAGICIVMAKKGRQFFVFGHLEYDRMTLDEEYKRDLGKGLPIDIPKHYYPNDDPTQTPVLSWRAHCNTMYSNWLNYYVYQETPYDVKDIGNEGK